MPTVRTAWIVLVVSGLMTAPPSVCTYSWRPVERREVIGAVSSVAGRRPGHAVPVTARSGSGRRPTPAPDGHGGGHVGVRTGGCAGSGGAGWGARPGGRRRARLPRRAPGGF